MDKRKDYITPIINEIKGTQDLDNIKIQQHQISDFMILFSLYGDYVDEFLDRFIEFRAIDQKYTADLLIENIFKKIFKTTSCPCFNLLINIQKKIDLEQFKKDFPIIEAKILEKENPDGTYRYYKAEIDAAIQVSLYPHEFRKKDDNTRELDRGYIFLEMKMFTAPRSDPEKSLRNLLQNAILEKYFELRYIYGVIGISYLCSENDYAPISKNEPELCDINGIHTNILHVALMDARVLDYYNNAPLRSKTIMSVITKVQNNLSLSLGYRQKGYKFELIYNILKVIKMSQKIMSLENKIDQLKRKSERVEKKYLRKKEEIKEAEENLINVQKEKNRVEEEKNRVEEEKNRVEEEKNRVEEEKNRVEEEKNQVEKKMQLYEEKLKTLGIEPEKI